MRDKAKKDMELELEHVIKWALARRAYSPNMSLTDCACIRGVWYAIKAFTGGKPTPRQTSIICNGLAPEMPSMSIDPDWAELVSNDEGLQEYVKDVVQRYLVAKRQTSIIQTPDSDDIAVACTALHVRVRITKQRGAK